MINEKDKWIEERVMEFESAYMNNGINGVLRDEFQDTRTILIRNFLRTTLLAHKAHLKEQLLGDRPKERHLFDDESNSAIYEVGYNSALQDMTAVINKL